LLIPLNAIINARPSKTGRVLVPLNALPPLPADLLAINQLINLLAIIPPLRVLVAGTLDPDVAVGDEEFDVAGACFEVIVDGVVLVFADIIAYMQQFTLRFRKRVDEIASEHLIRAALAGHDFPCIVIAEADIVSYLDTALEWGNTRGVEGCGV